MYCVKCGREIPEQGTCVCGAQVSQGAIMPPVGQAPPYAKTAEPPFSPQPFTHAPTPAPVMEPPAITILRQECGSTLALALCLCLGIAVVLNIAGQILVGAEGGALFLVGMLLGGAPSILICVGLLLFYSACKKPSFGMLDAKGLTFCRVGVIVLMTLLPVALVIIGVVFILGSTYAGNGFTGAMGVTLIVFGVVFAGLCVFPLRTVSSLKNIATTGTYDGNISMVFIVLLFISGISSLASMLSVTNIFLLPGLLLSGGATLLMGILLNRLRKKLA